MEVKKVFQNKNAIERFQAIYLCKSTADVYFVFMKLEKEQTCQTFYPKVEAERIPAHKIILAANSSVFHGMFFGEMKETGDIKIVDATPHAFQLFLKCFYFKEMIISLENVGEIFYLAHKYDVTDCSAKCVEFLTETVQIDNVLYIYELAILFDLKDLIKICEKLICHETAVILGNEHFQNCTQNTLQRLLKIDCFNCNEVTVFEACMHWAEMECKRNNIPTTTANRKHQLSTCFNLIRFPSMDMNTLTACLNKHPGLFPADELEDIICHISNHRQLQSTTKFNPIGRRIWNVWHCNRLSTDCRRYITAFDAVDFTAKKTLLLEEVSTQVITSHNSLRDLSGTICIMKDDEVQLLQSIDFKNGIKNRIVFDEPIIIEAGKDYEIKIHLKNNWYCKGFSVPKRLLNRVVFTEDIEIKFKNANNFSNECLISDLFFKLNP